MGATTELDRIRLALDDALACLDAADRCYQAAAMLIAQIARSPTFGVVLDNMLEGRQELDRGRAALVRIHPDGLAPAKWGN